MKKIRPVGPELFHTDRQRQRQTKLTVAYRNFANAPKKTVHVKGFSNLHTLNN